MFDGIILADNLNNIIGLRHAYFTRHWGGGGFAESEIAEETLTVRTRMAAHLQVEPQYFLCCHQIHSPNVVTVNNVWTPHNAPQADAMVTDKSGIALGVLTADCVPVLLASTNAAVIGAAHAGWRGALCGVLENTVAAMEKIGAERKTIRAALGPCIKQRSYEVGADFPAAFLAENPAHERFFKASLKSGHYHFDLPGYVEEKLRNLGLVFVETTPTDTCAEPDRFFSYRYSMLHGQECSGRLVSAIALV